MTLEEAIQTLELMGTPDFEGHTEDILAARKLGIEALKWRQRMELPRPPLPYQLLPGQTRDE